MEPSDIFHPSLSLNGTLGPERFFHEWDADHDDYISEEEVCSASKAAALLHVGNKVAVLEVEVRLEMALCVPHCST